MHTVHLHGPELGPEGGRREQPERPGYHKHKDISPAQAPENVEDAAGPPDSLNDQQAKADPGQPPGAQGPKHPVRGPQRGPGGKETAMESKPDAKAGECPEGDHREPDRLQRPRRISSSKGITLTEPQWRHRCPYPATRGRRRESPPRVTMSFPGTGQNLGSPQARQWRVFPHWQGDDGPVVGQPQSEQSRTCFGRGSWSTGVMGGAEGESFQVRPSFRASHPGAAMPPSRRRATSWSVLASPGSPEQVHAPGVTHPGMHPEVDPG